MPKPAYRIDAQSGDGAVNALPVAPTLIEVLDVLGPESDSLRVTLPALTAAGEIVEHPPHGRRLRAWLGYANAELYDMGEYIVSGVDFQRSAAGYSLTVSADTVAALEAIKAPVDRSWNDIAIEDVFATIAGKHGLEPHISASVRSRIHGARIVRDEAQEGESDLAFLSRIGKRYNAQFSIKDGRALWLMVGDGKSIEGRDLPRHGVALEGEGLTWDVAYLDRPMYGKVEAVWTNFRNPLGNVVSAGDGEPVYRMRHPFAGEGEARLAAESMLDEFERAVADFTLTMPGRPEIRAGHLVDCATHFPVAGVWYVAEAQHVYDGGGLTTRLRLTAANGRG